eukprot:CAMPEP_0194299040 /NCGR_PEP_ID=MMETSP0169-20130528/60502_1 /TAXON_ID=218684 /ORGANISM="Corethron pennatum, Strain L29A3" /LENGTH=767 /DNA_ID=CAMNT_0039049101 /DNA_START=1032 /DNA_END=3335 /DNA_ORIENTATION=-
MSPAFDEDGVVFYGGEYLSKDGGENWQVMKASRSGRRWLNISCAKTHKDGIAFHPRYKHKNSKYRRRMVMMATSSTNTATNIWVSDDIGLEFRKLNLSPSVRNTLEEEKCPMLATMGTVTYLVTQSMAMFGTADFGESWSVVLPAQASKEMVMQVQVDQTSAQGGHEADTLLLVTKNKVYRVKPRKVKAFPLKFSAPAPVQIMLPDTSPVGHPINLVATHRGTGEESSIFVSRTRCPTEEVCLDTSNDSVITSHNITGHTWGTSEIKDWFALDRSGKPASHWKLPEFTNIKGVIGTPRVYIGTYSGIYRSDNIGDSWLELDTIANGATTLSISPAPVDGGRFARVTTCTYRGGCFWGEVDLKALGNDASVHIVDVMVPQTCKLSFEQKSTESKQCHYCLFQRYSVSVESPTFDIDHISLRIIGSSEDDKNSQIERSTNDFADVTIPLKTKIDAETCNLTGKCSPAQPNLRIIKFSPNFKEDKTVYAAGVQGLWRSTDNGLTFERLSGISRAETGETCSKCDGAEWTGRDIVSLSFSPDFVKDDTMVAISQSRFVGLLKDKRYISVSTDGGAKWTDIVWKKADDPGYWTSAVIIAGPKAPTGLTVVATRFREKDYDQVFINQASKALNHNAKWTLLKKVPKHKGVGLEKGGYSGYGIALLPSGELIMSVWGGGMVVGRINKRKAKLTDIREYNTPRLGGSSNMPGSNKERNFNEQVLVSPDKRHKGVIFGVDKQDIYASVNNGATWRKVLSIPFRLPRTGTMSSPKVS